MATAAKPPMVLVYTGEGGTGVFEKASEQLRRVLNPDQFVVYEMNESQVTVDPWKDNSTLLLVLCGSLEENIAELFRKYLTGGGKLIVCCTSFGVPDIGLSCSPTTEMVVDVKYGRELNLKLIRGKYLYHCPSAEVLARDSDGVPVIMKASCDRGTLVVSAVCLEVSHDDEKIHSQLIKTLLEEVFNLEVHSTVIPEPSPGYILTRDGRDPNLSFKEVSIEKGPSSARVPLLLDCRDSDQFDKQSYFENLTAKRFGEVTVFFPVTTSTMIVAEQFSEFDNVVAVAARQTSGIGRGNNRWVSPLGCAMFTLHLIVDSASQLGRKPTVLKYLAPLAVILGIRKMDGFQDLDLRLKWPNDLYYGKKMKVGGTLVHSTIQGDVVHAYIGIGVNTSNQIPTTCINTMIKDFNEATGSNLPELTTEVVIARTLSELELLVDDFKSFGAASYLPLYYQYWLHSNQVITIGSLGKEATIKELDEDGFLAVETGDGERLTLHPDGNSFDMMENMIVAK